MSIQPILLDRSLWGTTPVRLLAWMVEPGETVTAGESLAELAQPGMVSYLVAPCDGIVQGPLFPGGDIELNTPLGWIEPITP